MTYRLRNILIAVALALVAAMLTSFYVTNYQRNVQQAEEDVKVFVASRDIPEGTTGASLQKTQLLTEKTVERRNVVPGAVSDPAQLDGLVAAERIYAGEQVTTRRFTTPAERGVRAQLKATERAIAVPGDPHQLLVGTLKEGDRVDVVASWTYPEGSQTTYSKIVLRDILVLRAPAGAATAEKLTSGQTGGYAAMLKVTDTQVQRLYWVMKNGDWHLQLRPPVDAVDSAENVESSHALVQDGVKPRELAETGLAGLGGE